MLQLLGQLWKALKTISELLVRLTKCKRADIGVCSVFCQRNFSRLSPNVPVLCVLIKSFNKRRSTIPSTPSISASAMSVSCALIKWAYSSPWFPSITNRSALFPCSTEPMTRSQFKILAASRVAIAINSEGVKMFPFSALTKLATFNSPRRFLLPLGAQSDPIPILIPLDSAAPISAVSPYNSG